MVREFVKSESLRKHMLAVEACVPTYVRKLGEDEEKWAVTEGAALRAGISLQFTPFMRAVAHSSATFRKFRTFAFPTMYGFGLPGARLASTV